VAEHGEGQPDLAAFGVMVEAEEARRLGRDTHTTWAAAAEGWRIAGWPYREAYARLREAAAAIRAGQRERATRALTACRHLAAGLGAIPMLAMAERLGLPADSAETTR